MKHQIKSFRAATRSESLLDRKLGDEHVLPRTSQPPPADFRRQFELLLSHHPALLYVGVARAVSRTLQSAEAAAQRGDSERMAIVDSANVAGGYALLVIAATEAAQRGDDTIAIVARLESLRSHTRTWAMAASVDMAVRGGRLPGWSITVVELLGLTPIARIKSSGKSGVVAGLFGRQRLT